MSNILWSPDDNTIKNSQVTQFINWINTEKKLTLNSFNELYDFSVRHIEDFWQSFLNFSKLILHSKNSNRVLLSPNKMPGSVWFPDLTINFAENLLSHAHITPDNTAITFWVENQIKKNYSYRNLNLDVQALRHALVEIGLDVNDHIGAITANTPSAIAMCLATTAQGAVWSSCSPDFGVTGLLDRLEQVEPKILFAITDYYYKGKLINISDKITSCVNSLPSVKALITYSISDRNEQLNLSIPQYNLNNLVKQYQGKTALNYSAFNFNHPLYIMFSSGTTGKPKCIVHVVGGTLLNHLKEHRLHCDLKPKERFFYNTTCGWMMWNWLISGLASGAQIMLYDGFPLHDNGKILLDFAEQEQIDIFGTSAGYLSALQKLGLEPKKSHNLTSVRSILSTGSVLSPESFDFVYEKISPAVQLSSISGGTDIIGCFGLGSPLLPVRRGELQCRGLGLSVEVFNEQGNPVVNQCGELVCTKPFPNMPLGFLNDPDNKKYKKAYFERYPNIWTHGDYISLTNEGGLIFYGRSDATLNPGGVRIGTAEIYRQLENFDFILSAIVVGKKVSADEEIILFVKLKDGLTLTSSQIQEIKNHIKNNASPRHVPKHVIQVADLPVTRSGKLSELAVKKIVNGETLDNVEALANPEALDGIRNALERRL